MYVFKPINSTDTAVESRVVYKTQNLNSASLGISSFQTVSGSSDASQSKYWDFLEFNCYLSGSPEVSSSTPTEIDYFNNPLFSIAPVHQNNKFYRNKFDYSASLLSIPNTYIGEGIRPNTFYLRNTVSGKQINIKDDGYGNLYSTNAIHSQSANSAISSSDNYVGNIFYKEGLVTLTETASWSGSVTYQDCLSSSFNFSFDSTETIHTMKWGITIEPHEFNDTLNTTARGFLSGSDKPINEQRFYRPSIQKEKENGNWSPYMTTICLFTRKQFSKIKPNSLGRQYVQNLDNQPYRLNYNEMPVVVARLSQPVQIPRDMTLYIEVHLDI